MLGRAYKRIALFMLVFVYSSIALGGLDYQEGVHYKRLHPSAQDAALIAEWKAEHPHKIKVVEFFSYACHWCQHLDPYIVAWLKSKPAYIDFYRVPVNFQPAWRPLTKMYFAAESLGLENKIHEPLFKAIAGEVVKDTKDETMIAFAVQQGIDKAAFIKAYQSFAIENRLRWANNMAKVYKIMAIPTIVVVGPTEAYYTHTAMAGDEDTMIAVVNFLTKQVHQTNK